jgi:hypothetical protein
MPLVFKNNPWANSLSGNREIELQLLHFVAPELPGELRVDY